MKLPRSVALAIHFVLDQCLPPILRDSRWLVWIPFRLICGEQTELVLNFKKSSLSMNDVQFKAAYDSIAPRNIDRETDLNEECLERIISDIAGKNVLEVGCGRGFLCRLLEQRGFIVTGADMRISDALRSETPDVNYVETNIECQPFANGEFETVICTHTLEHVQNLPLAVRELRRVAEKRLIIVTPKQRNYLYTFDLHLHFFPYPHDLLRAMGKHGISQTCNVEGGDLYYLEQLVAEK